jgi:hypothetical protein
MASRKAVEKLVRDDHGEEGAAPSALSALIETANNIRASAA